MSRIHILPPILANQIAAGEVIERPASVIKELLENSLDAGATQLDLHLEKAGKKLIRIQDNGKGIHPEDLPLALARHATSKIKSPADLAQIQTLGFRGEALASIASIARLTIASQHQDFDALSASAAGRDMDVTVQPCAHPRGTTVEVKDLFFNTPARRKFLKSERTEFLHIEDMIKRLAIARHDIGLQLFHDGKLIKRFTANADNQKLRVQQVLGQSFMKAAVLVDEAITQVRLTGWVAKPEFARSSHDMQFFYVNGRMVRDKVLNHAVRVAFEDKIYPGRFPSYVLYLECDPASVDVNVHPTKHEVRFREGRLIHDFIVSSLQKVLQTEKPSIQVQHPKPEVNFNFNPPDMVKAYQEVLAPKPVIDTQDNNPFGRVIALLDNRVVVSQQDNSLHAIDWPKTLKRYVLRQWEGGYQTMPLLLPLTLQGPKIEQTLAKLQGLGFKGRQTGPNQCVLQEQPRFLQGLTLTEIPTDILKADEAHVKKWLAEQWAQSHPKSFRDIERTLASAHGLSDEIVSSKHYIPDLLV